MSDQNKKPADMPFPLINPASTGTSKDVDHEVLETMNTIIGDNTLRNCIENDVNFFDLLASTQGVSAYFVDCDDNLSPAHEDGNCRIVYLTVEEASEIFEGNGLYRPEDISRTVHEAPLGTFIKTNHPS